MLYQSDLSLQTHHNSCLTDDLSKKEKIYVLSAYVLSFGVLNEIASMKLFYLHQKKNQFLSKATGISSPVSVHLSGGCGTECQHL